MKRFAIAFALAGAALTAAPASAALTATGTACGLADIAPSAVSCSGFYSGNLLNNNQMSDQQAALALLGYAWDGTTIVQNLEGLNGSTTVDFTQLLNGTTFIGIHFGNGQGSPGRPDGDDTAFYRIDANNLDVIRLAYGASSTARLYSTSAVPEPGTWAMMLMGFGMIGGMMRRSRRKLALA